MNQRGPAPIPITDNVLLEYLDVIKLAICNSESISKNTDPTQYNINKLQELFLGYVKTENELQGNLLASQEFSELAKFLDNNPHFLERFINDNKEPISKYLNHDKILPFAHMLKDWLNDIDKAMVQIMPGAGADLMDQEAFKKNLENIPEETTKKRVRFDKSTGIEVSILNFVTWVRGDDHYNLTHRYTQPTTFMVLALDCDFRSYPSYLINQVTKCLSGLNVRRQVKPDETRLHTLREKQKTKEDEFSELSPTLNHASATPDNHPWSNITKGEGGRKNKNKDGMTELNEACCKLQNDPGGLQRFLLQALEAKYNEWMKQSRQSFFSKKPCKKTFAEFIAYLNDSDISKHTHTRKLCEILYQSKTEYPKLNTGYYSIRQIESSVLGQLNVVDGEIYKEKKYNKTITLSDKYPPPEEDDQFKHQARRP